jgi:hypothetical protein
MRDEIRDPGMTRLEELLTPQPMECKFHEVPRVKKSGSGGETTRGPEGILPGP